MSGVSLIDVGVRIRGEVSGPGDVQIRGHIEGRIHVSGSVWVDRGGVAAADVIAARVRIDGLLEGRVRASRQVSVGPEGRLVGDVWGTLVVDEGGEFQGRIIPDSEDRLGTSPGRPLPRPRSGEPDRRLRLPTKRRVTQPSAERPQAPATAPHPAVARPQGGEPRPEGHPTPRRLVATPRAPVRPPPLLDEPPPPAPSTAHLPAVQDRHLPPAPTAAPRPAHRRPPAPVTAPSPLASPPAEDLEDRWFEEADFLVKRAEWIDGAAPRGPQGAGPAPSSRRKKN